MKRSELTRVLSEEFGEIYGGVLMRDHWIRSLGATGEQALEGGVPPKAVWYALCDELGVPEERRHGRAIRDPKA